MVDLNGHEAGNGGHSQGTPTAYRPLFYSERCPVIRLSGTDAILVTNCRLSFRCGRQRFLRRTSLISPNHKSETQLLHHGLLSPSTRQFYRVRRGFLLRRLDSRADFGTDREEHYAPAPFFRKVVRIAFNAESNPFHRSFAWNMSQSAVDLQYSVSRWTLQGRKADAQYGKTASRHRS